MHRAEERTEIMASMPSNTSISNPFLVLPEFWGRCIRAKTQDGSFTAFLTCNLLLLPILFYILFHGYQLWRHRRLLSAAPLLNLIDIQTYHSIILQLWSSAGFVVYCSGTMLHADEIMTVGFIFWAAAACGLDFTKVMVCVLYYVAVVHPVHYLGLKVRSRARTCCIYIGWIGSIICTILTVLNLRFLPETNVFHLCFMGLFWFIIMFCCISVLHALKKPRPGEAGGDQKRDIQQKQRAFHVITTIMAALVIKFLVNFISSFVFNFVLSSESDKCNAYFSGMLSMLPSDAVLPLIYLYRAGKLPCLHSKSESGTDQHIIDHS